MAALSVDGTPMPALPNSADQINYDNTTSGLSATTVKGAVDELASEKQDKTDNSLATTDKTVVGAVNELKSGLTNDNMVPKVKRTLGTILISETQKRVTATKNGYITVNSNNVGASNPTVRCYMQVMAKEYGLVTSDKIPAYTGVYFGMLPVAEGDKVDIVMSGHTVDATITQISNT